MYEKDNASLLKWGLFQKCSVDLTGKNESTQFTVLIDECGKIMISVDEEKNI